MTRPLASRSSSGVALASAIALACAALPSSARAEVTAEKRIVEHTGYTLKAGEWKLGIRESSYGVTDRLQVNSYLLASALVLNAGVKYQLVDAPNLAVAVRGYGGASLTSLLLRTQLLLGGAALDATFPLGDRLAFSAGTQWTIWSVRQQDALAVGENIRLSWFTVRGGLQWVMQPRHVFFLELSSPTSWNTAIGAGAHDFDMLDFADGRVGYQYSRGIANLRLNLGWGPSLFGRGPTAGVDFYVRF